MIYLTDVWAGIRVIDVWVWLLATVYLIRLVFYVIDDFTDLWTTA